jgi:hypothetical protein
MEAIHSSETSVYFYWTSRHHIREDSTLHTIRLVIESKEFEKHVSLNTNIIIYFRNHSVTLLSSAPCITCIKRSLCVAKIIYKYKKFWEELIAYFPTLPTILHCRRNVFIKQRRIHRQIQWLSFDRAQTAQKMKRPTVLLLLRVLVALGTCLPSRCLVPKIGIHLTKQLPSNDHGNSHRHTDWSEEFLQYAAETGSGVMIYIPSFMRTGWGIQKSIGGIHRHIVRRSYKPTLGCGIWELLHCYDCIS